MVDQSFAKQWEPLSRPAAPFVVVFVVVALRLLAGSLTGRPVHGITLVGIAAGTVGVVIGMTYFKHQYPDGVTPTERLVARYVGSVSTDARGSASYWVTIAAGAVAGGSFPTVFHGLLGLESQYISHLYYAHLTAVLWGMALFFVSYEVYEAMGLFPREDAASIGVFAKRVAVFTVTFAVVIGFSRLLWLPLLGY
ncbi:hypothetical protein [Halorubellus sp. PRR65]|uniref:hypothetical protein n=1 Tax=Halorubellus sp. PRR65 TaxID=3098148 RepID=UPI002B2573FA|nr:hypothetical protein [Halorubellus sp. PRR65]